MCEKQLWTVINDNSPTHPSFLKYISLTVIISKPWVYICQADICINTTQVEPSLYDRNFSLNILLWQNSLTIPWHGLNGQNSLTFFKIPRLFPHLENFFFPDMWQPWKNENAQRKHLPFGHRTEEYCVDTRVPSVFATYYYVHTSWIVSIILTEQLSAWR